MKNPIQHHTIRRRNRVFTKQLETIMSGAMGVFLSFTAIAADDAPASDHSQHQHQEHTGHDMSGHTGHTNHAEGAYMDISHSHGKGAWMFEYQFMRMDMEGLLDGTDDVSTEDISGMTMSGLLAPGKSYFMAPTKMTMDMHMLMAMYGVSDKLMVMGMLNYVRNDMEMVMHMFLNNGDKAGPDMTSDMNSSGIGDSVVGAMYRISTDWQAGLNLNLPTGSIDEKGDMDMGSETSNVILPYPMQLGSGTYDLIPSVQYKNNLKSLGWGANASYTFRTGKNSRDYTLGDRLDINAWGKYAINRTVLISGRVTYADWGKVEDESPSLATMSPNYDPNATGGKRVDIHLGVAGFFGKTHSLGLEYGVPFYQDLNGPQMKTDSMVSLRYYYMLM